MSRYRGSFFLSPILSFVKKKEKKKKDRVFKGSSLHGLPVANVLTKLRSRQYFAEHATLMIYDKTPSVSGIFCSHCFISQVEILRHERIKITADEWSKFCHFNDPFLILYSTKCVPNEGRKKIERIGNLILACKLQAHRQNTYIIVEIV